MALIAEISPTLILITAPESATVVAVAELMRDKNVGSVLIVDEAGLLTGILTDRDVMVRLIAAGGDPATTTVGEICTRDLHTVSALGDVESAIESMLTNHVRRLPMVDDDGKPVGIITIDDLATTGYVTHQQVGDLQHEISLKYRHL